MKYNDKFEVFNRLNPLVYKLFKQMALFQCESGNNVGSKALIERIRWEYGIKVSNIFTPYYSRRFVREFPEYTQFFTFKKIS